MFNTYLGLLGTPTYRRFETFIMTNNIVGIMKFFDIVMTTFTGGHNMASEVVKYHNDLNTVAMRNWNPEEMDFFFAILAKVRDEGTKTLVFTSDEVRKISRFTDKHTARWEKTMENAADKITQINYIEKKDRKIRAMNLFSFFEVDLEEKTVCVQVSQNFEYILNHLDASFTRYELEEIVTLKSTYAKTAYRLLKQWRTVGRREFKIDEFRFLFDIPKSYKSGDINRRAINPILQELVPFFKNLKCKVVKENTRGNPITAYVFSWSPEKTEKWVPNKFADKSGRNNFIKTETIPKWFNTSENQATIDEKLLSPEIQVAYQERLKRIRENKPK